jgi:hypothetical protein
MPFNAIPGFPAPGPKVVLTVVFFGVKDAERAILCAKMVLGLSELGKVPTVWSGRPLATTERWVLLQDQLAVAVAFTEGELLKRLEA